MTVGRISLARGEAPLYMLDNVAYLRQGSSDVQAQPLNAIISELQNAGPGPHLTGER